MKRPPSHRKRPTDDRPRLFDVDDMPSGAYGRRPDVLNVRVDVQPPEMIDPITAIFAAAAERRRRDATDGRGT